MDKINLNQQPSFPMSIETLDILQRMINLSAAVASLGGTQYILQGCELIPGDTDAWTPGIVVINGEILPFDGGIGAPHVIIVEQNDSLQVYDQTYQNLYSRRKVVFGNAPQKWVWSEFKRFPPVWQINQNLNQLQNTVTSHLAYHTVQWNNILNRPQTFPPSNHTHPWTDIQGINGLAQCIYTISASGNATKIAGNDLINYVQKTSTGVYRINHNIDHTRYYVAAVPMHDAPAFIQLPWNTAIDNNRFDLLCFSLYGYDVTPADLAFRLAIFTI